MNYNYGTSCIACSSDINDMLKRSSDFYTITCKCGHTGEVVCLPCIERGIPSDKLRNCSRCGGSLTTAQRMRAR